PRGCAPTRSPGISLRRCASISGRSRASGLPQRRMSDRSGIWASCLAPSARTSISGFYTERSRSRRATAIRPASLAPAGVACPRSRGKEVTMYDVEDPRREGDTSPWGGEPMPRAQPAPSPTPPAEPPRERTWESVDRVAERAGEMAGTATAGAKKVVKRAGTTGKKVTTRARGAAKKAVRTARSSAKKAATRGKKAATRRRTTGKKVTRRARATGKKVTRRARAGAKKVTRRARSTGRSPPPGPEPEPRRSPGELAPPG